MLAGAGRSLAEVLAEVNERIERARDGVYGCHVSESQLFQAEVACRTIHDVQVAVQNGLFDCEHELRELREREVSPAELLVDGERLIRQYRFLRRRARIIDGLLGYSADHELLRRRVPGMHEGTFETRTTRAPICPRWRCRTAALP